MSCDFLFYRSLCEGVTSRRPGGSLSSVPCGRRSQSGAVIADVSWPAAPALPLEEVASSCKECLDRPQRACELSEIIISGAQRWMCLFLHTLTENFLWCNHFFPEILAEMTQDLTSLFYRSFASAIFLNSPQKSTLWPCPFLPVLALLLKLGKWSQSSLAGRLREEDGGWLTRGPCGHLYWVFLPFSIPSLQIPKFLHIRPAAPLPPHRQVSAPLLLLGMTSGSREEAALTRDVRRTVQGCVGLGGHRAAR